MANDQLRNKSDTYRQTRRTWERIKDLHNYELIHTDNTIEIGEI